MTHDELIKKMTFNKDKQPVLPLAVFEIDDNYLMAVYQGSLSDFDMLIKYRQKLEDSKWSLIRTPKHIHWAVDVLIKLHEDRALTQEFLDYLIKEWGNTKPAKSTQEQKANLKEEFLLLNSKEILDKFESLNSKGEYSIKFLLLMARLLMIQEKTNYEQAYMFKDLLKALRQNKNIFAIVSTATHTGR